MDDTQPEQQETLSPAEKTEAATCMIGRMFGAKSWAYILKALKNRYGITDEQDIHRMLMTVLRRLKIDSDPVEVEARRNVEREQLLELLDRVEEDPRFKYAEMPDIAAKAQYGLMVKIRDQLSKLDALYLSDHVKTKAVSLAIASKLSDEQLNALISEEVERKVQALPTEKLEAEIERRKAS